MSWSMPLGLAALAGLAWLVLGWTYNLYLHPLRRFPGPKLAAMTRLYEFWYDVVLDGRFLHQMERMHQEYGPIVRINPRELHIADPEYYSEIYSNTHRVDKDKDFVVALGAPSSGAATIDHGLHRSRRALMNPYFSKRAIAGMEAMMHQRIDRLCDRLGEAAATAGATVGLDSAFSALTSDIIMKRFYGYDMGYLDNPGFRSVIMSAFMGTVALWHVSRFFPRTVAAMQHAPIWLLRALDPAIAELQILRADMKRRVLKPKRADVKEGLAGSDDDDVAIVLSALGDESVPIEERSVDRLIDEGLVLLFAGTETSSRALSITFFYLLNDKRYWNRLRRELRAALPPAPQYEYSMAQLENVPYLSAVVNEGLRLSFGTIFRLPRVATDTALQYKEYTIPPGTPVSQSTYFMHTDPEIFPDPWTFEPERWLRAAETGFPLTRYLVNFSRGSRQCLGISMAATEIHLTIAKLVLSYDMELCGTTIDDLALDHVRLAGYPSKAKKSENPRGEVIVKVLGRAPVD